ncbi:MAG: helicase-related protein [Candidatus Dojkabacteria bacterium]
MERIKLIKTLPHLIPLFLKNEGGFVYSNLYSREIVEFLNSLESISSKSITFSSIKKYLEKVAVHSQDTSLEQEAHPIFNRTEQVADKLDYSIKGDIVFFWPVGYEHPVRIEFFGEDLETMYLYDELYGRKIVDIDQIYISQVILEDKTERESIKIRSTNEEIQKELEKYIFLNSIRDISPIGFDVLNTDFTLPPLFYSKINIFENEVKRLQNIGYEVLIKSETYKPINVIPDERSEDPGSHSKVINKMPHHANAVRHDIISSNEIIKKAQEMKNLAAGFSSESLKIAVYTDREIYGTIFLTRPEKSKKFNSNIQKLLRQFEGNIEMNDYVVHEDYGIAQYAGLSQQEVDGTTMEYLELHFFGEDVLFVPINQIEKITKYIGNEGSEPKLSKMGRVQWEHVKDRVKKSTSLLASQLVEHFAKREVAKAVPIDERDSKDYEIFVKEFKYKETDDQFRSINEVLSDLTKDKPMNRLLVGDVGFGKTEVIMRAAFKIVEAGGQVGILAPTTILAAQHEEVFKERFKSFPFSIEMISRFNTKQKNNEIVDKLNQGKVDIVVGTHRLLSNDVKFKKLKLLVVDEEQKFGVAQKEKIKSINYGVHVLSVSATPIPRTLSMALSSIQDISIISTPPFNRKAVKTEIIKNEWNTAVKAIEYEVQRGGQVYFVHNQVMSIKAIEAKLKLLLPGIKYVHAHGQMSPTELDRIMSEFYIKKYDVLIATSIIENGLDIPNVNTMIINKAQNFGLSQLYQLRGRVGRSDIQGYCYLMYDGATIKDNDELRMTNEEDQKVKVKPKLYLDRLQTLVDNQELGAGFRIASRDLEIRGAGNILGDQQSGYISTIGYALYIEILATEVEKLKEQLEQIKSAENGK